MKMSRSKNDIPYENHHILINYERIIETNLWYNFEEFRKKLDQI